MEIPERIKYLSLKWKKGNLTAVEKDELDKWYDTPLPESLELEGNQHQLKTQLLERINDELGHQSKTEPKPFPIWLKVAAAIILFCNVSFFSYQYLNTTGIVTQKQMMVSTGVIRRIILPDSTIVWLKGKSELTYPKTFGIIREVSLAGEALFEVKHDKKVPFVIKSGQYETTVLGTSFNLKTGNGDQGFDISVLTGKVGVLRRVSGQDAKVVFVAANQTFKAESGKVESIASKGEKSFQSITAGTQYDMAFVKMPFEDIMHRFEQKFDVRFEGYTGEYKSCRITADLTNQPLEQSLRLLCGAINATYKINDHKIKLMGGGCFDE